MTDKKKNSTQEHSTPDNNTFFTKKNKYLLVWIDEKIY